MKRDMNSDLACLADAFFDNLIINKCEFGGIGLDGKRPFGNGDVEADMLEIIGWQQEGDNGYSNCYASWQNDYVRSLYKKELIPYLKKVWGLHKVSKGLQNENKHNG